ncbi:unnamed protein product [Cuscuta campestris]|uniref:DUF4283 domain-containing protein n=1 Tax=Cuscuta campestris TaxID=132261 RepID=A0A484KXU1_9ASTE|nr:unnamed protein product [Cuscuta campestris]
METRKQTFEQFQQSTNEALEKPLTFALTFVDKLYTEFQFQSKKVLEDIAELSSRFKLALVAKFLRRPSFTSMTKFLQKLGLRGSFDLTVLSPHRFLINFHEEEDYLRLFLRRSWLVFGYTMTLSKWSPSLSQEMENPVMPIMPIWIAFPDLPIHLHDKRALHLISSSIGTPLKVDSNTLNFSRPGLARCCVEVDISNLPPAKVLINHGGEELIFPFYYENVPLFYPDKTDNSLAIVPFEGFALPEDDVPDIGFFKEPEDIDDQLKQLDALLSREDFPHLKDSISQSPKDFSSRTKGPWIIGGDFNTVASITEHKGAVCPDLGSMDDFNKAIADCDLISPSFLGSQFTWFGNRGRGRVCRRLDRILINEVCLDLFHTIEVKHLGRGNSDHRPLLLNCLPSSRTGPKPFKFLNVWSSHPTYRNLLISSWDKTYHGGGMRGLVCKLSNIKATLLTWNKETFGNLFQDVKDAEKRAEQAEEKLEQEDSQINLLEFKLATTLLLQALKKEESFWAQKANIRWISQGDALQLSFTLLLKEGGIDCVSPLLKMIMENCTIHWRGSLKWQWTTTQGFSPLFMRGIWDKSWITSLTVYLPKTTVCSEVVSDDYNGKKLEGKATGFFKGIPSVSFTQEDIAELSSRFKLALVAKFLRRPSFTSMTKFLQKLGLRGSFDLTVLSPHRFLINFHEEEDYLCLFLRRSWLVFGYTMTLSKWSPSLSQEMENPVMPIWIAFPDLPIHLHDKRALHLISSSIGTPLKVDSNTLNFSRPGLARSCVEVDISNLPPAKVTLLRPALTGKSHRRRIIIRGRHFQKGAKDNQVQAKEDKIAEQWQQVVSKKGKDKLLGAGKLEWRAKHAPIVPAWKEGPVIEDEQILSCCFNHLGSSSSLWISSVYGRHTRADRVGLWNSLRNLHPIQGPWIIGGDFNTVASITEHKGAVCPGSMDDFNKAIADCDLISPSFLGSQFTLFGNKGRGRVCRRLDRILINEDVKDAEKRAEQAEEKLEQEDSQINLLEFKLATALLQQALKKEESLWAQKANIRWISQGDASTAFFHSFVKGRRHRLCISSLKYDNGKLHNTLEGISKVAVDHYSRIFSTVHEGDMGQILDHIPNCVSPQDNSLLRSILDEEEIRRTIWSLNANSTAGPDGFNGFFFRDSWEIIKIDVCRAVQEFFVGIPMPKAFGSTLITLIPKQEGSITLDQFRPISLSTFFSKIIFRLLSERLKTIIPKLISQEQAAFQPQSFFPMKCGVKQGDPLSPLLLIIALEDSRNLLRLRELLSLFMKASGKEINYSKSQVIVHERMKSEQQNQIRKILSISKKLNQMGRLILIKHVLSSIPLHLMAAQRIPKSILKSLNRLMANYFWGINEEGPKYHWRKWEKLCFPFEEGGLGLRNLLNSQDAAYIDLWWKVVTENSIWGKFMKSKYFRDGIFSPKIYDSYTWKAICKISPLVLPHCSYHGEDVAWLSGTYSFKTAYSLTLLDDIPYLANLLSGCQCTFGRRRFNCSANHSQRVVFVKQG